MLAQCRPVYRCWTLDPSPRALVAYVLQRASRMLLVLRVLSSNDPASNITLRNTALTVRCNML